MEESKAATYYEELHRKGVGAARFKQGLGFSPSPAAAAAADPASSSPFSAFVRASSPGRAGKQAQLDAVQRKLNRRRSPSLSPTRRSGSRRRDDRHRRRSPSRDRGRRREGGRGSPSPTRRSHGMDDGDRRRSRHRSPGHESDGSRRHENGHRKSKSNASKSNAMDYSKTIQGYSEMTPAERVKARMKLQLSQTAAKDTTLGFKGGWERFDFNKDAPIDDDEMEVAEDDASVVKGIGLSFRFAAVEAKREEQIKAAHDEAMFGTQVGASLNVENNARDEDSTAREVDLHEQKSIDNGLLSDKILMKLHGSWRDRACRARPGSQS